jgi:creatinine amidohydrolase
MTASLFELASPDVTERLASNGMAVLPLGSVEQHGPHLPCGTDTIASESVARALAERVDALYVPFCPYGVTPIHAGYPGTVSVRRQTFEALLTDVSAELIAMGATRLVYVNWHELNTPSADAVAIELQDKTGARVYIAQACYVARRLFRDDGGELTHGGGIEALAVLAHDPSLVRFERVTAPDRPPGARAADVMRRSREVYGFVTDVMEVAPEGWHGDPGWATPERAAKFPDAVVDDIITSLRAIGALEDAT